MRFIIMHKTNAHWEAGAIPTPELIADVGALIGDLAKADAFRGGEGLRSSAQGVRLNASGGTRTMAKGPFIGGNELPAGFTILKVDSLDRAIEWASQQAKILGDVELDIRPLTEPWDIGITPKPANVTTERYMVLRKATAETENGIPQTPRQASEMGRLVGEAESRGEHVVTVNLRPSARGRRYSNSREGITFTDGPFAESKELIGGYVIVEAGSLEEAARWAERYITIVDTHEVDVRELAP